ncbi:hypothetical protein GCM10009616_37300 [Microlunatus lacustris]
MRPEVGEVLHFSEDPSITRFVPHVAVTASDPTPYVWALDAAHAPSYWFPRQCPRAMAWVRPGTTDADRERVLGPHTSRVHLVEYGWLPRLQTAQLFAYRFDATAFEPYGDDADPHAFVARNPVRPLGPAEPVGDLLALHEAAQVELRLAHSLWPWWEVVIASTVGFSGIRLRNARGPGAEPSMSSGGAPEGTGRP